LVNLFEIGFVGLMSFLLGFELHEKEANKTWEHLWLAFFTGKSSKLSTFHLPFHP
jgi:hypothetical protein